MIGLVLAAGVVLFAGRPVEVLADAVSESLRLNLAWQIALERVDFSPGLIDGRIGPKTQLATREFQRVRGLPKTGALDKATREALGVNPASAVTTYVITRSDAAQVGSVPTDWLDRSRLDRLGYESLEAVVAEKFHCSRGLLARLNPTLKMAALKPGDSVRVPNVSKPGTTPRAKAVRVHLGEKVVRVVDADDRLVALFHCSIAAKREQLPSRDARVAVISHRPDYTFDPAMWPEVKGIDRKLRIPPGPRNPVGLCWIGLDLPGYGIHGTPNPEMIGKTGSHGCFRLTNWDALRLSEMVRPGTPVKFQRAG